MEAPLQTCILLAVVWLCWVRGWKQYQLDLLRQDLFLLRGTLFDMVAAGQVDLKFTDSAYVSLRSFLNGHLRFCHKLNMPLVFWLGALSFTTHTRWTEYRSPFDTAVDAIKDEQTKLKLKSLRGRVALLTVRYLVMTSPTLMFIAVVGTILELIRMLLTGALKSFDISVSAILAKTTEVQLRTQLAVIDSKAEQCGNSQLQPA